MDLKQKPTILTQAALLFSVLAKTIVRSNIQLPFIKMMLFTMDLTKDCAFGIYLYQTLFNQVSKDRTSSDDIYLFGTYMTSLFLGQILLASFCLLYRHSVISSCPHGGSKYTNHIVSSIMILLFPITGIIMSISTYMDDQIVNDEFERIANGFPKTEDQDSTHDQIDWSIGPITKSEYEHLVAKQDYIEEKSSLGGFEFMKAMESLIESFLQILITLVMLNQLPQEGMLNKSIFAFSSVNEDDIGVLSKALKMANLTARNIFILISVVSYLFLGTGMVALINVQENNVLTIKEKVILILIHLVKVAISFMTSTVLILLKSERHPNLGFICWLSILGIKCTLLAILTQIMNGRKRLEPKTLLLLIANMNTPIQMRQIIQFSSKGKLQLDRSFLFVWILCGMET